MIQENRYVLLQYAQHLSLQLLFYEMNSQVFFFTPYHCAAFSRSGQIHSGTPFWFCTELWDLGHRQYLNILINILLDKTTASILQNNNKNKTQGRRIELDLTNDPLSFPAGLSVGHIGMVTYLFHFYLVVHCRSRQDEVLM